jgi:hypothetical protein
MSKRTLTVKQVTVAITEALDFVAKKNGVTVSEVLYFCEMPTHPIRKQVETLCRFGGEVLAEGILN